MPGPGRSTTADAAPCTDAAPCAAAPSTAAGAVRPASVAARAWGWRHAGRPHPALHGLDLDIRPGERILLAGPSGAGKSTLLHALAGVLHPDEEAESSGTLLVDGEPASAAAGRAGLMQQDPETQVVQAKVGDDVAFGAENLAVPREEIARRVPEALQAVGLRVPLDHPTSELSGGQKQRLALAGILAMRPGLVLLDEPTANLDPDGVLEVRDAVVGALDGTGATAVIVEHRLDAWAPHVDRVVVLEPGGGVSHDGIPEELFAPGPVREELIAAGVWVPGYVPGLPPRYGATPAAAPASSAPCAQGTAALLAATGLAVARTGSARPALSGVGLDLRAGEAVCVTGPNGAGKSTLALTMAGLLPERSGTVRAGKELRQGAGGAAGAVKERPHSWRAADLVSRIGTVFQEPEHQFVASTVRDELAFGPLLARVAGSRERLFTDEEVEERVSELLRRLRLEHVADANPFTLSGGEKRRLSVATVLASGPSVLVLDEPTFGQDANTWRELALLLRERLEAGATVLAVTHDAHFGAALGARIRDVRSLAAPAGGPAAEPGGATDGEDGNQAPPAAEAHRAAAAPLTAPRRPAEQSLLGRANPLAKLAAVMLATLPLVASLDMVSSGLVVAATLLLLPLGGLDLRDFAVRSWPLLVAGLFGVWGTALVGNDSGSVLVNLGVFTITEGSLGAGIATGLRTVSIAVPTVLVMSTTDPTDLANALAQRARLPHRFVLGALAGMRLLGLLAEEWQTLGMARRARGVGANGTLLQRTRARLGQAFGLLVQAIRRASRLAVTMEAKGFGGPARTWSRESTFRPLDGGVAAAGLAIGCAAVAASVAAGAWNLVWAS